MKRERQSLLWGVQIIIARQKLLKGKRREELGEEKEWRQSAAAKKVNSETAKESLSLSLLKEKHTPFHSDDCFLPRHF